jgi:DNA-binding transcriptional regulator PaaX
MRRGPGKKRNVYRLGTIERDILGELSLGDLLLAVLCSGRSSKAFFRTAQERAVHRYRRGIAVNRLIGRGYLRQDGNIVRIHSKGLKALERTIRVVKHRSQFAKWDRKWRIVSFDIPENLRPLRGRVRSVLRRAGFVKLHQSLWIFPYDCEELISLIKEENQLRQYILYGVLESIENDAYLKRKFKLDAE